MEYHWMYVIYQLFHRKMNNSRLRITWSQVKTLISSMYGEFAIIFILFYWNDVFKQPTFRAYALPKTRNGNKRNKMRTTKTNNATTRLHRMAHAIINNLNDASLIYVKNLFNWNGLWLYLFILDPCGIAIKTNISRETNDKNLLNEINKHN